MDFPNVAQQLVLLEKQDQADVKKHHQRLRGAKTSVQKNRLDRDLAVRCHDRTDIVLKLLGRIGEPSISRIGRSGSQAVVVLVLHSYLEVMEYILSLYQQVYAQRPHDIYGQGIPPLTDRIMILRDRKQLFGTNWIRKTDGSFYLAPVEDFERMNERRIQYGLEPARRPVILSEGAKKYPLGKGLAKISDQQSITDEDYESYAKFYLQKEV